MNRTLRLHDPLLFWLAIAATLVGAIIIFDAGYARSLAMGRGPIGPEFKSQLMFLPIALALGWVAARFSLRFYKRAAWALFGISFASLLIVEVFGHAQNGAARWINLGPVAVQPSEFAKLGTIVFLAAVLADRKAWPSKIKRRKDVAHWLDTVAVPKFLRLLPGLIVLVAVGLIEAGKDLGTAAVVAAIAYAMFVIGGVSRKTLVIGALLGIVAVGGLLIKQPYRMERITNHAHRWDPANVDEIGYQTAQAEAAMAQGGVLGVGIGAGRAKHVLPATTTDFVMATVGEEFGLWGSLGVIGLLGGIVWRLFFLAQRVKDRFAMLVLSGVGVWFGIQGCVNIMMANGFLPAIGIPLPFISSGGSSLVSLWLAMGVCQSVLAPTRSNADRAQTPRGAVPYDRAVIEDRQPVGVR